MEVDPDEQQEEAHTAIYEDSLDFGYFNMAHGMLVEIEEELREKFPHEERVRYTLLNTIYLSARSGQMMRFVEALNTISSSKVQSHLVNMVSALARSDITSLLPPPTDPALPLELLIYFA